MERINLNGTWRLRREGDVAEYPAAVPGSVLATLLEAQAIPDPYDRMNEYEVRDLFWKDYRFSREFDCGEALLREAGVDLVCEGLDTLAEIFLNGEKLCDTDNMHRTWRIPVKDRLRPGNNSLEIVFKSTFAYISGHRYREGREIRYTACGAVRGNQLLRKAHSMFGWDWGPQLPDAGIFRDIYLEGVTGRRIGEIRLHQEHEDGQVRLQVHMHMSCTKAVPGQQSQTEVVCPGQTEIVCSGQTAEAVLTDVATGEVVAESSFGRMQGQMAETTLTDVATGEIVEEGSRAGMPGQTADGPAGTGFGSASEWDCELVVKNPKLWWPNGYGEQPLYRLSVTLRSAAGDVVETQEKTVGFRTLTVSREEDPWGREFAFQVNGVKIFAMGASYIPEDCIYSRITPERQEYLLESARRAHFNCIRVWGGGYYPSDEFYEICDRKGLIVWQDLMFACNVYDATDDFMENISREIADNVKRLRHHPSLGLWCGNNELESAWNEWEAFQQESPYLRADYIRMFEQVIPRVVARHDPDTFFWPSSPSSGGCFANPSDENDGDVHYWSVWHGQKPFTDYRNYYFRFCSEFGFQSFPSMKTIRTFTKPEDRNIFSRVMESHQKNGSANGKILYYLSENFRYPADFDSLLYVSQILQGMAMQYGVEHWRRNRGRCMGALYWQLNDNWPVASWSSIDYFGRWKALHYMAKRFYATAAASIVADRDYAFLYVENETPSTRKWKARIRLKNMELDVLGSAEAEGSTGRFRSEQVLVLKLFGLSPQKPLPSRTLVQPLAPSEWEETVFLEGRVVFDDGTVAECVETFLPYKHLALKRPNIGVSVEETAETFDISLTTDCFAPFVELDVADADVLFEDNYFHLTERETRTVRIAKGDIRNGAIADAEDLGKRLTVRSLTDS